MSPTPPPEAAGDADVRETTDVDAVRRVVTAVETGLVAAEGTGVLDEAGQRSLAHRGLEDARAWTATAPNGRPVGFALLRRTGDAADLALGIDPAHRGAGLGARLAAAALEDPDRVLAWSHVDHPAARVLAERHRFARVRELLVMERPATDLPGVPDRDDVRVRSYRAGEPADEQAVLSINAAAFASHPEQGAMDARDLAERQASAWFDPAGLLLAEDVVTGEVLGFHWTKLTSPDAEPVGEVYVVGIAPAAQGRGLGTLLTAAGLAHLSERGATRIELYVEGDNAPARAVYSGLGFAVRDTHVQYARG